MQGSVFRTEHERVGKSLHLVPLYSEERVQEQGLRDNFEQLCKGAQLR